jgi:hypothetical protein
MGAFLQPALFFFRPEEGMKNLFEALVVPSAGQDERMAGMGFPSAEDRQERLCTIEFTEKGYYL